MLRETKRHKGIMIKTETDMYIKVKIQRETNKGG